MKLSQQNQDLLFKAGLVTAGYFLLAKPILNFLGITKSQTDRDIEQMGADPASPFNPNYWRNVYYFQGNPNPGKRKIITVGLENKIKAAMKKLIIGFGYFADDEDMIFSAIKGLGSKAEVSLLSYYFNMKYKKDLLEYLRKGRDVLPENGLSDAEMKTIINYVAKLPII